MTDIDEVSLRLGELITGQKALADALAAHRTRTDAQFAAVEARLARGDQVFADWRVLRARGATGLVIIGLLFTLLGHNTADFFKRLGATIVEGFK